MPINACGNRDFYRNTKENEENKVWNVIFVCIFNYVLNSVTLVAYLTNTCNCVKNIIKKLLLYNSTHIIQKNNIIIKVWE